MNQHLSPGRGAAMRRLSILTIAAVALSACAEAQLGAQVAKGVARAGSTTPAAVRPASEDPSLAPEAFDATGLTIWDGAATLQGVWFAHPLAQRAQRVRVSNLGNGLTVEGAMFRRDPALSGPSILVSSDAARSLGLTPGSPTELRIVALREGPAAADVVATQPTEPAPAAPAVETETLAAPEPVPQTSEETELAAVDVEAVDVETVPVETAPEPAPAPVFAPEPDQTRPASPAPQPRPAKQAPAAVASAATPVAAPEDPQVAAIGPAQGALPPGAYLQIGSFGIEFNARILVARMKNRSQPAQYVNRVVNGNPFSVVVVGPLIGQAAIDEAKAAARAEGQPNPLEVKL